jgi:hypothetical protein
MTIGFWKMRIDSYKNDYKEDILDYVSEILLFIGLIMFTPLIAIVDIMLLPIYLIAYILKKGVNRMTKEQLDKFIQWLENKNKKYLPDYLPATIKIDEVLEYIRRL